MEGLHVEAFHNSSVVCEMRMRLTLLLVALMSAATAQGAQAGLCGPAPEIRAELQKASESTVVDPTAFDTNVAPFLAVLQRHRDDIFVNERYEEAVQQYGVEGYLRALTEEYQSLSGQHPGDLTYHYLFVRSLIGRNTPSAIRELSEIATENPDFAPVHGALAAIYASDAFHDAAKEKTETERFEALCPGASLPSLVPALPPISPQFAEAELMFEQNGDAAKIVAMAEQSLHDDEWRLQRVRPFDWYTVDYKRQTQREMQAEYWKVWSLEVRSWRKAGNIQKADALLAQMDQRSMMLHKNTDPVYWLALSTITRLYAEGNQKIRARTRFDELKQFLAEHPDADHATQLKQLGEEIGVDD
jgi:hypothetical protein